MYSNKLNKIKHCLVIGQQSIGSCVYIVIMTSKLSDIIKMILLCDSLTLSCHILLSFSKL